MSQYARFCAICTRYLPKLSVFLATCNVLEYTNVTMAFRVWPNIPTITQMKLPARSWVSTKYMVTAEGHPMSFREAMFQT
jgi:hypothetical protein